MPDMLFFVQNLSKDLESKEYWVICLIVDCATFRLSYFINTHALKAIFFLGELQPVDPLLLVNIVNVYENIKLKWYTTK